MKEKDPIAWAAGSKKARQARRNVASQLDQLITEADLTGSRDLVARRITEVAAAARAGDSLSERAALMELATAAACTAASIDLEQPVQRAAKRRPRKSRKSALLV
jgi:hypothetical protein